MLYVPSSVASADLDIAQSPAFGGEYAVYIANIAAVLIGTVNLTAPGVGTYTDNPATGLTLPTANDLQLVCQTYVKSAVAPVIKLAGMDDTGTPVAMDGTATFAPPARSNNQKFNFQRGIGTDLVPAVGGKKFSAITGLAVSTPITGGGANQEFTLWSLPQQADYSLICCTTDATFNTKSRMAKGVDCGMEADAFIKRGKTQPGELSLSAKLKDMMSGLPRFDGDKCTVMLVGLKDGVVTSERWVFTQFVGNLKPSLPEGDGEVTVSMAGKFVEHFFFVAP